MSLTTLAIPKEYGYVLATAIASAVVNQWHGMVVGGARKAAKVPYPNCYATAVEAASSKEKYAFNCAQRSHSNYLETLPNFLIMLFIGGLGYPTISAALGMEFLAGRVVYTLGYTRSTKPGGAGRYYGAFWYIGYVGVLVTSVMTAYNVVMG